MRDTSECHRNAAGRTVRDIRRKTRKRYSSEYKIRIALAGLRGEDTIAELCRQEGIVQSQYYSWFKEFMESGRKRLAGDTAREANTGEVQGLHREAPHLITSPAFVVIKAADEFRDKTTAINQMWQTDFTYIKIVGWGWFYLSTILDDFYRYVVAWKLCATMKASDVTDTLELALKASGCDQVTVLHKPRLLPDNGASYVPGELAE